MELLPRIESTLIKTLLYLPAHRPGSMTNVYSTAIPKIQIQVVVRSEK